MCSRVWFVTDRRISQEYPQLQILRALKERCADEDVEFRSLLMDQIVLTISDGQLGKYHSLPSLPLCFYKQRFVLFVRCRICAKSDWIPRVPPASEGQVVIVWGASCY